MLSHTIQWKFAFKNFILSTLLYEFYLKITKRKHFKLYNLVLAQTLIIVRGGMESLVIILFNRTITLAVDMLDSIHIGRLIFNVNPRALVRTEKDEPRPWGVANTS